MTVLKRCLFCLCVCVFLSLPGSYGCNSRGRQVCNHNSEMKRLPYASMFSREFSEFTLSCQRQQIFLACALQKEYVTNCGYKKLVSLYALNRVHDALCSDNGIVYNQSRSCILQLDSEVEICVRRFTIAKVECCDELEKVRMCVRDAAKKKEQCSHEDIIFLGKIIDVYLKEYAHPDMYNCEMDVFADEIEVVTTHQTASITDITSEATTQNTRTSVPTFSSITSNITAQESESSARMSKQVMAPDDGNSSSKQFTSAALLFITLLTVYARNLF